MADLAAAIAMLFLPLPFVLMALGVLLGIVVGAIPGLTASMLIALTLPLTFYMDSVHALILLVSMYVGGVTGSLITATLLRMPGTPSAVMTTLDGYPMARGGEPGKAIGWGIMASFVGGLVSWVFLATVSLPLSRLALTFSPFDYFAMVMMAMVLMAAISQGSLIKGLLSGFLGILAAMPGIDPIGGDYRLTFGFDAMQGGLSLLPVLIGLFAGSQILKDVVFIDERIERISFKLKGVFMSLGEMRRQAGNLLRSSLIGTWVGILPGIGANIGSMIAYSAARSLSKTPERFGKGAEEGIVASEAGNNATVGGALIPLIALGIPGSVVDAILLGALVIHNVQPGPGLFRHNPEIVNAIIATALVANFVMLAIMYAGTRWIARLAYVPRGYLLPIIMVFCVLGCFALANRWFDVGVMLAFAGLGFVMERAGIPLGPFVIGMVLAPIAEESFRSGLMMTAGSLTPLLTGPVSLTFLIVGVLTLLWPVGRAILSRSADRRQRAA